MYLFVFEDGNITGSNVLEDVELSAVKDGYLEVIDISDPQHPKYYDGEKWEEVCGNAH